MAIDIGTNASMRKAAFAKAVYFFRSTIKALFVLLLALPSASVVADELRSLKDLKEHLKGEPVVNMGSDDVHSQLPEETPELIAHGRRVYMSQCAACHGEQLQGQPNWTERDASGLLPAPPHNETGHTWHHADDQLFEVVKYGPAVALGDSNYRSAMPAFKGVLTDSEILAVLVYIRSTWPAPLRDAQSGTNDYQSGG